MHQSASRISLLFRMSRNEIPSYRSGDTAPLVQETSPTRASDIKIFIELTLRLTLELLSQVVTLFSFVAILWQLSGSASILGVEVPGVGGGDLRALVTDLRNRLGTEPAVVALIGVIIGVTRRRRAAPGRDLAP